MSIEIFPLPIRPSKIFKTLGIAVFVTGLVICVVYLFRLLSTDIVQWHFNPTAILAIIFTYAVAMISVALGWREMIDATTGHKVGLAASIVGQASLMIGKYIPGKIVGLAGRASSLTGNLLVSQAIALALIEQAVMIIGLLIVGMLAHAISYNASISLVASIIVLLVVFTSPFLFSRRVAFFRSEHHLLKPIFDILSKLNVVSLSKLLTLSIISATSICATTWFIPDLLTIPLDTSARLGLVMAYALGVISGMMAFILPGGIGAREATFIYLASPWLCTPEAVAVAAALRVINVSVDLVAGTAGAMFIRRL